MDTDVIVIGAGPTGLMLATELRLGGAEVTVVERFTERTEQSRGLGFTARAAELLQARGLLERLENVEISPTGHFGGIPLDFSILEGSHFGVRGVPQFKVEEMLQERALELGVRIERGQELSSLEQDEHSVTAVVHGPAGRIEYRAAYLVGCDGGRSLVRKLAGFEFPGSDATCEMYLADVSGCEIKTRMIGELLPNGMVMAGPLDSGYFRIIVCETGNPPDQQRQVSFGDVADAWQRLTGDSIHHGQARWVSRFTDATRQATQYRRNRVLLAGDSAHIHLPAGGQGMSIGLQDAVNLGWKLAATVRGRAPHSLLDTYHDERHPVGERVLRNTRAQGRLNLAGSPAEPIRSVVRELMALPEVARHLSGMVSGFDIRYPVGASSHPLVGRRMPDRRLDLREGTDRPVAQYLRPARGVLITADSSGATSATAAAWADRVDVVEVNKVPAGPEEGSIVTESLLLRPDGYVAWAAPGTEDDLTTALERWFGPASASGLAAGERPLTTSR
ncbi:FAD-dependent monooxygenase [Kineosporia babensis]|uniref:FAD-dependent monooxygenase n=1 Tax=Kineosporia babensis TaxID=499548 RepID=A0A9X1NK40_9ACTN|nr:FAD-dependent monooxygenase [Kineosporia babensis]MCD5315690.1 FAD-dependent monooxygenase [Kineosporia babensis]